MPSPLIDTAGTVRQGEELDLTLLVPWLSQHVDGLTGTPKVTQYSGGVSNWTYCLTFDDRELILRRAPDGTKAKGAHDMKREHDLQRDLKPVFSQVPSMYGYCEDPTVIGSDFYVMEKLNGIIPRRNLPKSLHLSENEVSRLCQNAIDTLVALHKVDYEKAGLSHLGKGAGYTQRQIEGWSKRYQQARTWNVPRAKRVMSWLESNTPTSEALCITHNDFRFDNLVLDTQQPTTIIGILDWELATIGDPLMDLGNTLAYWVEAGDDKLMQTTRKQPTNLPGMMSRQEVIDYYCGATGHKASDFAFYEVYGLFRLAAIAQQIYFRYHHKQTRNPAYKHYWFFVHYLIRRCNKIIKSAG
ncbi:phosphotransferase family protein [Alteromonas facilis]|uniref:phosphotransferase family protein n=1 Tax=Alteromonas facilis TaxID=2048004 RepID=UPI000C282768|nr:phosphotransferase family protein [Alteromonas facilis]